MKDQRIEYTAEGFILHSRRFLWFWESRTVQWNDVNEIKAIIWDCFLAYPFGYRLVLSESESVCMTDEDEGWEDFNKRLYLHFPDINESVVKSVKVAYPEDVELVCWHKNQTPPGGRGLTD